jgi:Zn-dependent peptidase ImmA (M78 family)
MKIKTRGIPDKLTRALCKEAIRYYGNELLGSRLSKNITINVIFEVLPNPIKAMCQWQDDNHRCREFVILIHKKLNKKQTLITLAHEMVHVKQYATGELKDYLRTESVRWQNKVFSLDKVKYWSSPWEKEAYKKDEILYEAFKKRNR